MIRKIFEKHEMAAVIALIVLYVGVNSVCLQSYETTDIHSALVNTAFSVFLLSLVGHLKRTKYYGLKSVRGAKKYLYFAPLVLIASVNLWGGVHVVNTAEEIVFHCITMLNVGLIEELIFRGFLYRMMEKNDPKAAAVVSAVTFGIGHIVNLLNGAELTETLLQLCYAMAIGWLFVVLFRKSGSLLPCIITHGVLNALSVFYVKSELLNYLASAFLIIVSLSYAFYIDKKVKKEFT